jgi:hypothetical protein
MAVTAKAAVAVGIMEEISRRVVLARYKIVDTWRWCNVAKVGCWRLIHAMMGTGRRKLIVYGRVWVV